MITVNMHYFLSGVPLWKFFQGSCANVNWNLQENYPNLDNFLYHNYDDFNEDNSEGKDDDDDVDDDKKDNDDDKDDKKVK